MSFTREQQEMYKGYRGDRRCFTCGWFGHLACNVINRLDPIEELYDMYSEEEDTPRIVELGDNRLDLVSDIEGLADPYMDL